MEQLTCHDLAIGYNGKAIEKDINFSVKSGEYVCIFGENGSGKSTLIKTLLHLLPPVEGEISMGDDIKQSEIGYLPQQSVVQKDFPASVREVVLSGCQNGCGWKPFYTKAQKSYASDIMKKLKIGSLERKCYRELSGGQQQRVLLARALCATRKMLILDEPVTGLDPDAADEMYRLINKINKEDGITIIMISHDVQKASAYADRIICLGDTRSWQIHTETENGGTTNEPDNK